MGRRGTHIVLIVLSLLLNSSLVLGQTAPKPAVFVAGPTFDFGRVSEGEVVEHAFRLENRGNAPLRIFRVEPDCGCTLVQLPVQSLAPGKFADLVVQFDTEGFWGEKEKAVRVYTNDPNRHSLSLVMKGVIERDVVLSVPRVYFGSIRRGVPVRQELVVDPRGGSGVKIESVDARSEFVTVNSRPSPNGGLKIQVEMSGELPLGLFNSRLAVRTTSKRHPTVIVPVIARVVGDIEVTPAEVSFGLLRGPLSVTFPNASYPKLRVLIKSFADGDLEVKSISTTGDSINAELKALKPGKQYQVTVSLTEKASGTINEKVVVKTNHQDAAQAKVTIPVYAIVSDSAR